MNTLYLCSLWGRMMIFKINFWDMGVAGQHLLPISSCLRAVESQSHCCGSGVTCRPDQVRTADFLP